MENGEAYSPALGTMIEEAVMQELMTDNPVRKTRLPRRGSVQEKIAIAPETIQVLFEKLSEPSRSIAVLLTMTGLRIGELLALRWQDVDLQNRFLTVRQTVYEGHFDGPKSQRSKRTIPLSPIYVELLSARKPASAAPSAVIYSTRNGSALSRRNLLNRQLKPVCKAGISANWHWLRHANTTLLDAVGTPLGTVQALLGHSSSSITRETYIHSVPVDARRAVNEVEKLVGPNRTQIPDFRNGDVGNPVI